MAFELSLIIVKFEAQTEVEGQGYRFILQPSIKYKVGRTKKKTEKHKFKLEFKCMSEVHALLWIVDDKLYIKDQNSTNGTAINSQKLTKRGQAVALNSDDIIVFGQQLHCKVTVKPTDEVGIKEEQEVEDNEKENEVQQNNNSEKKQPNLSQNEANQIPVKEKELNGSTKILDDSNLGTQIKAAKEEIEYIDKHLKLLDDMGKMKTDYEEFRWDDGMIILKNPTGNIKQDEELRQMCLSSISVRLYFYEAQFHNATSSNGQIQQEYQQQHSLQQEKLQLFEMIDTQSMTIGKSQVCNYTIDNQTLNDRHLYCKIIQSKHETIGYVLQLYCISPHHPVIVNDNITLSRQDTTIEAKDGDYISMGNVVLKLKIVKMPNYFEESKDSVQKYEENIALIEGNYV